MDGAYLYRMWLQSVRAGQDEAVMHVVFANGIRATVHIERDISGGQQ